jgi:hypothetical protein
LGDEHPPSSSAAIARTAPNAAAHLLAVRRKERWVGDVRFMRCLLATTLSYLPRLARDRGLSPLWRV